MISGEIEGWARERNMRFYALWPSMRGLFRGGEMFDGGDRELTNGWSGTLGGLPVFGFQGAAGRDPDGALYVVAVQLPGITFPPLTMMEATFLSDDPGVPIDTDFDLRWKVVAPSHKFARDLIGTALQEVLFDIQPDFSQIWLERDAVLLSARGEVSAMSLDRYLHLLRRLVDKMPTRVLNALRRSPSAPTPGLSMVPGAAPMSTRAVPGYYPVRPLPPRPLPMRAPVPLPSTPRLSEPRLAPRNEWALWSSRRGWLYYPNGREIAERFNHGPLPGGRHVDAFAGKFGELPVFGWRTVTGAETEANIRQVICVRKPGMKLEPVRVTLDNPTLTQLVGSGDIEVGDPDFDERWRVTSESPESARAALTPAVWKLMAEPFVPKFAQLWFERDVAAVITESPIGPDRVDDYLSFLHKLVTLMGR